MKEIKITQTDISEWYEFISNTIIRKYNDIGEIPPMVFYMKEDGYTSFLPLQWQNDKDKEITSEALKMFALTVGVIAYIFVSEGWMIRRSPIERKPDNYDTYGRPSEAADKEEIVMKCNRCNNEFSAHLLQYLVTGMISEEMCSICALKERNKVHGLPADTPFTGTIAKQFYEEALKELKNGK